MTFSMATMFPFIDLDSGGSVQGMIAGDEKVLALIPDDVKIIPGHGPLAPKMTCGSLFRS